MELSNISIFDLPIRNWKQSLIESLGITSIHRFLSIFANAVSLSNTYSPPYTKRPPSVVQIHTSPIIKSKEACYWMQLSSSLFARKPRPLQLWESSTHRYQIWPAKLDKPLKRGVMTSSHTLLISQTSRKHALALYTKTSGCFYPVFDQSSDGDTARTPYDVRETQRPNTLLDVWRYGLRKIAI